MKGKSYSPEQIVTKLREVERLQAEEGLNVATAAKRVGVAEWTIYRWRKQYVGMSKDDVKRLKDLEKENARLKKLLAEKELDNSILKEAVEESTDGRTETIGRETRHPDARREREESLRDPRGLQESHPLQADAAACGQEARRASPQAIEEVPEARVPQDHRQAPQGGLAGQQEACRAVVEAPRPWRAAQEREASAARSAGRRNRTLPGYGAA